ncbi:hypothetical protein MASR1M101_37230 [Gemmatimonas sp.]
MTERLWDDADEFPDELDDEGDADSDDLLGEQDDTDDTDDADADLDDDDLDDDFPVGDGVADLSGVVSCPYCGESVEITLDPGGGANQQYIEDCQVCCRPWVVSVSYDEDGTAQVFVDASDDHDENDD